MFSFIRPTQYEQNEIEKAEVEGGRIVPGTNNLGLIALLYK